MLIVFPLGLLGMAKIFDLLAVAAGQAVLAFQPPGEQRKGSHLGGGGLRPSLPRSHDDRGRATVDRCLKPYTIQR